MEAMKVPAQRKSATQIVVVSGVHDHQKRNFQMHKKLSMISEWFVGDIV